MPDETILIVEDAPESLKFAANVLRGEGYKVHIASTAEQALSTLRFLLPDLILVDFVLPGMNGLELTANVKRDARLQSTKVVALTGCVMPGDVDMARQAGCDGYLTKPIDARALAARVRQFLDYGGDAQFLSPREPGVETPGDNGIMGLPPDELEELRESFLKGGKGLSRQLLASLDEEVDAAKAGRTVHQWIGTAGLLGFPGVAHWAREVETVLRTPPWTAAGLRGPVASLARSFHNPTAAASDVPSQPVIRALTGKRVALIGLSNSEADRMCGALEQVGAKPRLFDPDQSPYAEAVGICQLAIVQVRADNRGCRWLADEAPALPALPTIFLGAPEYLVLLDGKVHARACGLMTDGCLHEETLMRLRLAISPTVPAAAAPARAEEPGDLVIADSDKASREVLKARLEQYGLRCRLASNGPDTILLLRDSPPRVAVVDVNMDGFEVLAAIRAEAMPVRTIFATHHPHENEILRGFSLGAEDYLAQPFSPVELAARLKRLLR